MKKIELVFRSVGERTSKIALELTKKNICPDKIHVIENVKPFSKAVKKMLKLEYDEDTDFVVAMDADCLILEDMRPFLNSNNNPYVDCYVLDKFRGKVHMGVHITRIDVINEMKRIHVPKNDLKYVLRPESRLRNLALANLNFDKFFKRFKILHDFCQYYKDIFAKYAIRELRSRTEVESAKLAAKIQKWPNDDCDFKVAKEAIHFSREIIMDDSSPQKVSEFIINLPEYASNELKRLKIREKKTLKMQEVLDLKAALNVMGQFESRKEKIFCIGLSRTGTKSLTLALNTLGYNVIHYPVDETILSELVNGNYKFSLLEDYDGIADITVSPYYAQLDKLYPNSKFILTLREKDAWLESLRKHWEDRPPFNDPKETETHLKIRRFLRGSVYGTYKFARHRLSYVYDLHLKNVKEYFKDKPGSLLILDIFEGAGYTELCSFLGIPLINQKFPHVLNKNQLSEQV